MARLPKCPVCQQGRQVLYSRQGKTYNKGHKAMKATDYRICHSCDTIFDKNDNICIFCVKVSYQKINFSTLKEVRMNIEKLKKRSEIFRRYSFKKGEQ